MDNNGQTNKKNKKRRFSLALKLNLTSVLILLAFLAGILVISYQVQKNRIQAEYFNVADKAAAQFSAESSPNMLKCLRDSIESDEFAEIRKQAVEANDPKIITDWMDSQIVDISYTPTDKYTVSLSEIYDFISWRHTEMLQKFDISSTYYVYMKGGHWYYLALPPEGLLYLGTQAPDLSLENPDESGDLIPARIYKEPSGTFCRSLCLLHGSEWNEETEIFETVQSESDPEQYGVGVVDINMAYIINASNSFLYNVLIFTLILTAVCIAFNLFFVRRFATKPLKELTNATTSFGKNIDEYSMENVIDVDIRSNDEINDLYREIQAMQTRIVTYTGDLTKLSAEKARASTEMRLAARIQSSMLKDSSMVFKDRTDFDIAASMDPAKEIGGDFYDFFLTDEDHLALIIADVSGKGIPAALFMMASMLLIKSHTESGKHPCDVLEAVNNEICTNNKAEMFITVWMGILDLNTGVLTCANAGHEFPVIRDNSGIFKFFKDPHGLVIGAMGGMKYREYELKLEPGDMLFVYTDGLPEATNASKEFYGADRITNALNSDKSGNPASVLQTVTHGVEVFVGDAEQFDDLTMLCVKYH